MILYHYERDDSPWIRIKACRSPGEKTKIYKTKIRKDDRRKASLIAAEKKKIERAMLAAEDIPDIDSAATWGWVPGFLRIRYGAGTRTHAIYSRHWKWLIAFLAQHKIYHPADLRREHCTPLYVEWRTGKKKEKSGRTPSASTAKSELKLLGLIMDEAVLRKMSESNPARKLRIRSEPKKVKPEISDAEAVLIYRELASRPLWMQRSFHIAIQTGLRFSETRIQRSQVQWADNLLQIEEPKGGRARAFSIPIYPSIRDLIREFWESGEPELWSLSESALDFASLEWTKFFRAIGLPHLCFHCTRVTFITRGARAGVPESAMMSMVNHGSTDIHRVYQRFRGADALQHFAKMALPSPPAPGASG